MLSCLFGFAFKFYSYSLSPAFFSLSTKAHRFCASEWLLISHSLLAISAQRHSRLFQYRTMLLSIFLTTASAFYFRFPNIWRHFTKAHFLSILWFLYSFAVEALFFGKSTYNVLLLSIFNCPRILLSNFYHSHIFLSPNNLNCLSLSLICWHFPTASSIYSCPFAACCQPVYLNFLNWFAAVYSFC